MKSSATGLLVALSALAISCSRNESTALERGRADARADLKRGKFALEVYGMRSAVPTPYEVALKDRYQVESRPVADCVVSQEILDHARGFNETMQEAIETRYGKGTLDRVRSEAMADILRTHKQPNKSPEPTPTSVTSPAAQEPRQP